MSNPKTLGFGATNSLTDINKFVAQNEGLLQGPLTDMGNDNKQSLFTFDVGSGKPKQNAVIAALKNGQPVVPPGSTLVVKNKSIFISGVLTPSSASRPN